MKSSRVGREERLRRMDGIDIVGLVGLPLVLGFGLSVLRRLIVLVLIVWYVLRRCLMLLCISMEEFMDRQMIRK